MFAVTINFIIIALGNARFIKFLIYVDLKIWRTFRKVVIFLGYVSELYNNKIARVLASKSGDFHADHNDNTNTIIDIISIT